MYGYVNTRKLMTSTVHLTSFASLLLGVLDHVLIALLTPDVVVVLHTAWLVDLRLLWENISKHP